MNYFKITDDGTLKTSEILAQMREKFDVYSYYDDKQLDKDFPKPKKPTTRYFKKTVEADEENKNKSANEIENGITLRERLLMELDYFNETGEHLDVKNITLCAGSRYSDGDVPYVRWGPSYREVCVCWCSPAYRSDGIRARTAVDPSTLDASTRSGIALTGNLEEDAGTFIRCPHCKKALTIKLSKEA